MKIGYTNEDHFVTYGVGGSAAALLEMGASAFYGYRLQDHSTKVTLGFPNVELVIVAKCFVPPKIKNSWICKVLGVC